MNKKQINFILNRIKSNSEYLTHIQHLHKYSKVQTFPKIYDKKLCYESVAKIIVQSTYLLYTCKILKVDIFLSTIPMILQKINSNLIETKLLFCLSSETQIEQKRIKVNDQYRFVLNKSEDFDRKMLKFIQRIMESVERLFDNQILLQNFNQFKIFKAQLKRDVQPCLNQKQMSIIKLLQKTQLFYRYSDILRAFRRSILYRIKSESQVIESIKKKIFICSKQKYLYHKKQTQLYLYREFQEFILHLVSKQIIKIDPSDCKTALKTKRLFANDPNQPQEIQSQKGNCYLNFYLEQAFQNLGQENKKVQKNLFNLEYSIQECYMTIKYISTLEISPQNIDSISTHSNNIAFQNIYISVQQIKSHPILRRPCVVFKVKAKLQYLEEPFTKFLILVEQVTIGAKLFLDLMTKKISKNQFATIKEYNQRFDHLHRLFVSKAAQIYNNL